MRVSEGKTKWERVGSACLAFFGVHVWALNYLLCLGRRGRGLGYPCWWLYMKHSTPGSGRGSSWLVVRHCIKLALSCEAASSFVNGAASSKLSWYSLTVESSITSLFPCLPNPPLVNICSDGPRSTSSCQSYCAPHTAVAEASVFTSVTLQTN